MCIHMSRSAGQTFWTFVVITAVRDLPCTVRRLSSKWYASLYICTLPSVDCTVCVLAIYGIFFKYLFKGVAYSFFVFIQPSLCLPVALIVITNFCATVNSQTIAPSTVPSYHILVMTYLLMCTLSPTFYINEIGFLMNSQVFQDVTLWWLVKVSNVSKDCSVFIFRVKQFKKSNCTGGIYIYICVCVYIYYVGSGDWGGWVFLNCLTPMMKQERFFKTSLHSYQVTWQIS